MVEVVAEDKGGAGDGGVREEGEGYGVLVVGVWGVGEVGGCDGGVVWEAWGWRWGLVGVIEVFGGWREDGGVLPR